MKKLLISFSLVALLFLGACSGTDSKSNQNNKNQDKSSETKQETGSALTEPVVVNGMELTIEQLKTTAVSSGEGKENKNLYGFEINGKNISSTKSGLGAIDFVLTTSDGKEHAIDDTIVNFGNEIEPDKSITGKMYFAIDKNHKITKLSYKPEDKVLNSWDVKTK